MTHLTFCKNSSSTIKFIIIMKSSNKLKTLESTVVSANRCHTLVNWHLNFFEFLTYFVVANLPNAHLPAACLTSNLLLCSYLTFAPELESVKWSRHIIRWFKVGIRLLSSSCNLFALGGNCFTEKRLRELDETVQHLTISLERKVFAFSPPSDKQCTEVLCFSFGWWANTARIPRCCSLFRCWDFYG